MHNLPRQPCDDIDGDEHRPPAATKSLAGRVRIGITLHFSTLYPKTRAIISIIIVYDNDIDQKERAEMAAYSLFSLLFRGVADEVGDG